MPHLKGPVPQAQAKEGPMPQLVKKRRSGWAVLAATTLVASLLAVGAGPAAALDEDSVPNAPAATSACVGDAAGDMMFPDVSEGHAFRGAINCLAYYGVTVGYSDGTFRPNDDVARYQMVLFMERAAAAAGADAEAVVGDFAETGSDPVHRGDMALLIARLLVASTTAESTRSTSRTTPTARSRSAACPRTIGTTSPTPVARRTASTTAPPARCTSWAWPWAPGTATSRRAPR